MKITTQLEGWKEKKRGDVGYLECPYCGYCHETVPLDEELITCRGCKRNYHYQQLILTTKKEEIAVCAVCETEVSITPGNRDHVGGFGYLCPRCYNMVAIACNGHITDPKRMLELSWNSEMQDYALHITDNQFFYECKSEKDYVLTKLMQVQAKNENSSYLYFKEKTQKAALVFDAHRQTYIGFIVWSKDDTAVLRQIYILESERRKGYGRQMLEFWVHTVADKVHEKYGVDSPNGMTQRMLVQLGHAVISGDSIQGRKCYFVRS